ncbi:iron-binding protein [Serendipita sp. 399]|nr:iron-binding protein [Serendipita sp. 399]
MGVSGSGKSTLGTALSKALDIPYMDGDDLHTPENVAKMAAGTPLNDDDRWPWLYRIRQEGVKACKQEPIPGEESKQRGVVIGCSALKKAYRKVLRGEALPPGMDAASAENDPSQQFHSSLGEHKDAEWDVVWSRPIASLGLHRIISTNSQLHKMLRSLVQTSSRAARARIPPSTVLIRNYHEKVISHYENPRNVGSLPKTDVDVGTGLVGAPACGDVMKLQIRVDENGIIKEAKFKTFGCGSAIASSSYMTELVTGMSLEEAGKIRNTEIAKELCLPPVKLHCSMLAEDAIRSAIKDYRTKRSRVSTASSIDASQSVNHGAATSAPAS